MVSSFHCLQTAVNTGRSLQLKPSLLMVRKRLNNGESGDDKRGKLACMNFDMKVNSEPVMSCLSSERASAEIPEQEVQGC